MRARRAFGARASAPERTLCFTAGQFREVPAVGAPRRGNHGFFPADVISKTTERHFLKAQWRLLGRGFPV